MKKNQRQQRTEGGGRTRNTAAKRIKIEREALWKSMPNRSTGIWKLSDGSIMIAIKARDGLGTHVSGAPLPIIRVLKTVLPQFGFTIENLSRNPFKRAVMLGMGGAA